MPKSLKVDLLRNAQILSKPFPNGLGWATLILMTSGCGWLKVGDNFWMLMTKEISWRYGMFRTNAITSVTNIKILKFVTNIDIAQSAFCTYFGRFSSMILIKYMNFWQFLSVLIKLSIFNRWLSGIVRYIAIISLNKLILFDRWRKRE